ncbi:MAG: T9SS C-terminal target domain-containing protein [Bacteroidetes bacterium]|nr:MAG: T9SS C-terminal target domain-containing protein [Bacteroidota bacterium]
MKKYLWIALLTLSGFSLQAQFITLNPSSASAEDSATLIFDASAGNGELAGAEKVYLHHGVVTDSPDGTDWQYIRGNWGQDDGIGEMTRVPGQTDKWQISFTPSIREYFNVPEGVNIFRIAGVFRSADGSIKGTIAPGEYSWGTCAPNLDLYINLNVNNFLLVTAPTTDRTFAFQGQPILMSARASSEVTAMSIAIDSGSGFQTVRSVNSGTTINYAYFPTASTSLRIKFSATINGEQVEVIRTHEVIFVSSPTVEALPADVIPGINYHADDDTRATLVLQAPGKTFAHVVGDFNDWTVADDYLMKKTPDGEYFWLELTDLTPGQPYVFQYWVDGEITIGDPYAELVADPWNDRFIDEATFPGLPDYQREEYGPATVLQTGQQAYQWSDTEDSWVRPDVDHLVIYELWLRDFIATHDWAGLTDTLDYLKKLGVDAIELMPFNEFEGNDSWGYNPNYYFAVDKFYGPKNDLKRFVETAHQKGLAVIMDMVLNHAYGTNPMVRLYWDADAQKPAADNPWFNREYVGPYSWGFDFNHESQYTKDFIDRVNTFWIEEFHIDGYRFDFTKGFTNFAPGGSIDGFDQSRINILKRMADVIWQADPDAYIILEHWGPFNEEQQLENYGMKLWSNRTYDMVQAVIGNPAEGNFNAMDRTGWVSIYNSHDERRVAEHAITEGRSNGSYDIKKPELMFERVKLMAAFGYLQPGMKMIWQFDEVGYDIDINFNGRTGSKPAPWGEGSLGYYEDSLRLYILETYRAILKLRQEIGAANLAAASTNHTLFGQNRRLVYDQATGVDIVLVGNFGLDDSSIDPAFTETGSWYNYFSGEEINVTNPHATLELKAGEWQLFTSEPMSDGFPGVVAVYENPVTITPFPFTQNQEITNRFDARKASPAGTAGLVGADKVYMQAGVALTPGSDLLTHIVGNNVDDGVGQLSRVAGQTDIWEISLVPAEYFGLSEDDEALQLGMYFRDATAENFGYGFRDNIIYYDVESDQPFVTITPAAFTIDDEITITFNARKGNRELVGADKVYMHSSVDLTNSTTPWNSAWNHVVGNWGADDGVGRMRRVPGETDLWEITLTPRHYYGLSDGDVAYWLAAVFRSADGNTKGTGTPGPIEHGFIHTNQDFFLRNQIVVGTQDPLREGERIHLYPNPSRGLLQVTLEGFDQPGELLLYDLTGRPLYRAAVQNRVQSLELSALPAGIYWLRIINGERSWTRQVVKQ